MPKTRILLILFLFFQYLPAQYIETDEKKDSCEYLQKDTLYSNLQYINFYTSKHSDGTVQSLFFVRNFVKYSHHFTKRRLEISYLDDRLEGFSNDLDSLSGHMRLYYRNRGIRATVTQNLFTGKLKLSASYNDYWGGGIGFVTSGYGCQIKASPFSGYFLGKVESSRGKVPLALYAYSVTAWYKKDAFKYQRLAPLYPDTSYQNDMYGDVFSGETHFSLPWQVNMDISATYGSLRAYLNYLHNSYGYLDHYRFFYYSMAFRRNFYEKNRISIGNSGSYGWSGKESFFEIWPFNYWSQLLASKTRITKTDMQLNLPFIEYMRYLRFQNEYFNLSGKMRIRWTQLIQKNSFIYKERYFIVYPVLIGYNPYTYSVKTGIDGFFLLYGRLESTLKKWKASVEIMQLLPVSFKNLQKENDFLGNGSQTSGGFWVSVLLQYVL